MDRNPTQDVHTDSVCKTNSSQMTNNTRLTPGKFADMSDIDKSVSEVQNYVDGDLNVNNFFLYSANIDTNAIWNTNKDLKRSYSLPSQSLYTTKKEIKEGNDTLNSIWNSKESLSSKEEINGSYKMSEISIDINDFENIETDLINNIKPNERVFVPKEPKENYTSEETKKIASMINSHEGWGVKPVNQKTPWDIPDADNNNNENYQNTFSNWFNEAPNGVCVWDSYETSKKQLVSDWSNAVKGKSNSNYAMTQPKDVWSTPENDSIWGTSAPFNKCGVVGSAKVNYGTSSNYHTVESSTPPYQMQATVSRVSSEKMRSSCWPNGEAKTLSSSCSVDRYTIPRHKNMEAELSDHKLYKDAQKQLIEQCQKDIRKIQEIDSNLSALSKLPEAQARPILTELIRQRHTLEQRNHNFQTQLDGVTRRLNQIEEIINNYNRTPYVPQVPGAGKYYQQPVGDMLANKMESMKLQQSVDFRPDVPEFIPGKKWYGLSQNGKENRNPTNGNTKAGSSDCTMEMPETSSYSSWLLIQNLPSHISVEMIQSFFMQNNTPCVTPIHSNPFSRWVLVKFPNQFSLTKAFQLLSGKVGQVSIISDQEANMKLQELKGVMARFVAH